MIVLAMPVTDSLFHASNECNAKFKKLGFFHMKYKGDDTGSFNNYVAVELPKCIPFVDLMKLKENFCDLVLQVDYVLGDCIDDLIILDINDSDKIDVHTS